MMRPTLLPPGMTYWDRCFSFRGEHLAVRCGLATWKALPVYVEGCGEGWFRDGRWRKRVVCVRPLGADHTLNLPVEIRGKS